MRLLDAEAGAVGKKIIDQISAGLSRRPGGIRQSYKNIGVHDARYVLFDNDTRLLITISFDNDFDKYFDDALATPHWRRPEHRSASTGSRHLEESPEGGYRSMTWEEVKNFLAATQTTANIFANTDDASVQEIRQGAASAEGVPTGARPPRGRAGAQAPGIEAAARRSGGLIRAHNGWRRSAVPSDTVGMPIIPSAETNASMPPVEAPVALELDDIQSGALQPRPSPYVGVYILLRIDDRRAGRELLRRLIPALADATSPADPSHQAWVSAALTLPGPQGAGRSAGLARQLPAAVPAGHGRARRRTGGCR